MIQSRDAIASKKVSSFHMCVHVMVVHICVVAPDQCCASRSVRPPRPGRSWASAASPLAWLAAAGAWLLSLSQLRGDVYRAIGCVIMM